MINLLLIICLLCTLGATQDLLCFEDNFETGQPKFMLYERGTVESGWNLFQVRNYSGGFQGPAGSTRYLTTSDGTREGMISRPIWGKPGITLKMNMLHHDPENNNNCTIAIWDMDQKTCYLNSTLPSSNSASFNVFTHHFTQSANITVELSCNRTAPGNFTFAIDSMQLTTKIQRDCEELFFRGNTVTMPQPKTENTAFEPLKQCEKVVTTETKTTSTISTEWPTISSCLSMS